MAGSSVIPAEAVEAAARAMLAAGNHVGGWDNLPRFMQDNLTRDAKITLEAAAPYILAQTLNDVLETRVEDCAKAWEKGWDAGMRFQPNTTNPYRTTK